MTNKEIYTFLKMKESKDNLLDITNIIEYLDEWAIQSIIPLLISYLDISRKPHEKEQALNILNVICNKYSSQIKYILIVYINIDMFL